jgi:pilus assembly protein CpaF
MFPIVSRPFAERATAADLSGKTTLANILTEFIPDHERNVLIEDTAEIRIHKENVLRFEARREQNGLQAVTIRDLLKATLRHWPDRIILGEIRGDEAFDLLQLLNTGHSGTLSTVHANSAGQGISRFTTCVLQSGIEMPYRAIKTNIADSLDVIVQIERRPGKRFVSQVVEIVGYKSGDGYLSSTFHPLLPGCSFRCCCDFRGGVTTRILRRTYR